MPPRKKRAVQDKGEENGGPIPVVALSIQKPTGLPQLQEALPAKPVSQAEFLEQEATAQAEDPDSKIRRRTYDVYPGGVSGLNRRETFVVRACPPLAEESSSGMAASDTAQYGAGSFYVGDAEASPKGLQEETTAPVHNKEEIAEANITEKNPRGRKKKGTTLSSSVDQGLAAVSEEQPKKRGRKKKIEVVADPSNQVITVTASTTKESDQMDCIQENDSAEDLFCPTKEREPDMPEGDAIKSKQDVNATDSKPETAKGDDSAKPKKRGRPKKPLQFVGSENASDEVETTLPVQEKSKRGRKKKEQVVEESEGPQDNIEKKSLKKGKK
ncbi:hypothetical protein NDU88_001960 [Pleurodeles waltl]|uniref:Uncharacterized protein n=1 Tax=Pleurodeles waltl TaxID=8319 RepID=A0AAV7TJA3_PLEWA|nr:hypothetical protein NDU88_001960 [Pleurodeles waltl]